MAEKGRFWSGGSLEPKRSFRWFASFGEGQNTISTYALRSFQKPSFEVAVAEYLLINDVNYHPGVLSWNPIEITITDIEAGKENNSKKLFKMMRKAGYSSTKTSGPQSALEKKKMVSQLGGDLYFNQIDAAGKVMEKWKIVNPFITNINFGQGNYSIEEIMTISMTIRYDYAEWSEGS